MENNQKSLTATQKMSRGAGWMSMGSIVSRVIGAIYIIPWLAMFGNFSNEANGLFNIGYQYYSLFLTCIPELCNDNHSKNRCNA